MRKFTDKINESLDDNKIMNHEQFIEEYLGVDSDFIESMRIQMSELSGFDFENIPDLMIEFAKYHVKMALESASEKASLTDFANEFLQEGASDAIDKESIINSYSIDNIK